MNMKKEQEQNKKQKKKYSSPEMDVVEMRHETNLLQGSGSEPPPWAGHVG